MLDAALFILAAREARGRKPIVTATEIIAILELEDNYSNHKGIRLEMARNGFTEVAIGCFTL